MPGYVILVMIAVILLYDQFLFRPLVAWADKFRMETTASQARPAILGAEPDPAHPRRPTHPAPDHSHGQPPGQPPLELLARALKAMPTASAARSK
jgi:NitT/TauT family transport system permease protein